MFFPKYFLEWVYPVRIQLNKNLYILFSISTKYLFHSGEEQDKEVDEIVKEIFGLTAMEARSGKTGQMQRNVANGIGWYISDGSIEKCIPQLITPDFIPNENGGKVLHRKVGDRDIYMVMNVDKNSECFFQNIF